MGRWLKLGEPVVSGPYRVELQWSYNLDDYPPGTQLPHLPMPDLSHMNPVFRVWAQRRLRKLMAAQRTRTEQMREEYSRRKGLSDGDAV